MIPQTLREYWEEHEYSAETTQAFLSEIKTELLDQGISIRIEIEADDNQYGD